MTEAEFIQWEQQMALEAERFEAGLCPKCANSDISDVGTSGTHGFQPDGRYTDVMWIDWLCGACGHEWQELT